MNGLCLDVVKGTLVMCVGFAQQAISVSVEGETQWGGLKGLYGGNGRSGKGLAGGLGSWWWCSFEHIFSKKNYNKTSNQLTEGTSLLAS